MSRMIFVNLPVRDLEKSKAFFGELGFEFDPNFTTDEAACMVVDENIFVMLLVDGYFKTFLPDGAEIADPETTEVLVALSAESREAVDSLYEKALGAGASEWRGVREEGPMYQASFRDPNGHVWEIGYMDMAALEG